MISQSAALALNHLLDQQAWARERLAPHAGLRMEFRTPPLPPARLLILESGRVSEAGGEQSDLCVTLDPLALPLLLTRRPDALSHVDMSGPEPLAAAVRALMLELRWDLEEDLSRVMGDVPAHRLVEAGRGALQWQRDAGERLARNFTEYWTEEQPLLARRADLERLAREVEALHAELDRLQQQLESR